MWSTTGKNVFVMGITWRTIQPAASTAAVKQALDACAELCSFKAPCYITETDGKMLQMMHLKKPQLQGMTYCRVELLKIIIYQC